MVRKSGSRFPSRQTRNAFARRSCSNRDGFFQHWRFEMQRSKRLLGATLAMVFSGLAQTAMAESETKTGEIKIGEINSYSLLPAFTEPYRKGWQLAVEQINAAGGINGKKLVVVSKDDG